MLDYQNNYNRFKLEYFIFKIFCSIIMLKILILFFQQKLSHLYLAKFLNISTKLFFLCDNLIDRQKIIEKYVYICYKMDCVFASNVVLFKRF